MLTDIGQALKHHAGQMAGRCRRLSRFSNSQHRNQTPTPIKLYWWTDRVNFGDVLSPIIVEYVSGQKVEWASLDECNLLGIGSIYGWLRLRTRRYLRNVHVWGSGIKRPAEAVGTIDYIEHHLVRGPLTAVAALNGELPTGDPGLLAAEALGVRRSSTASGIGVIPHRMLWGQTDFIDFLKAKPNTKLIDFRNEDCKACLEQIADCEFVLSSSLHGLIVADSLQIPNYWMNGPPFGGYAASYKFFDYGLAVGRDMTKKFDVANIGNLFDSVDKCDFRYLDGIDEKKREIISSFPGDVFGVNSSLMHESR